MSVRFLVSHFTSNQYMHTIHVMFIPHFRAESLEGISLNLNGVNTQLVAPAKTHHMRKLERGEEGRKRGGG